MSRFNVRIEGHYKVTDLSYGRDYVWTPTHHTTYPSCGTDHTVVLREVECHLGEEILHPWHPEKLPL